jgi:hypothetical protein
LFSLSKNRGIWEICIYFTMYTVVGADYLSIGLLYSYSSIYPYLQISIGLESFYISLLYFTMPVTRSQMQTPKPAHGWDNLVLPCGLKLRNRLAKGAMTENLADPKTNSPNILHTTLYERWGECGAGLLITGNVMVDRRYLECPGNVVVEDDRDLHILSEWARKSQANGTSVFVQISHPGIELVIALHDVCVG